MAYDFIERRRGAQPLEKCLTRNADNRSLMDAYALAQRAGAVIAPTLKRFHIAIDFSDPANCRTEDHQLVLLVNSALQENRIRQLIPRLRADLAARGLPLTDVIVRIMAKPVDKPYVLNLATCDPRPASETGAAAIDGILPDIQDEALRATMVRLRDALSPDPARQRSFLEERLGREALSLAAERLATERLIADLRYGIEAARPYIPSETDAKDYPRLEAERTRKLCEQTAREDRLRLAESRLAAIDARQDTVNQAFEKLASDPAAAEALATNVRHLHEETPDDNKRSFAPSAAGAAAIATLAAEASSPGLRKTLRRLSTVLAPDEKTFFETIKTDIHREIDRIRAQHLQAELAGRTGTTALSPEKTKRLTDLNEALSQLEADPNSARRVAALLYGTL